MALGTVLLAVALVSTLGLALASSSVVHLQLMSRTENVQAAENLARSAVARGIERVLVSQTFEGTVRFNRPEGEGLLTFSPDQARDLQIPRSTNNLAGTGSTEGSLSRVVPQASLHLIGVGRCRNVTRQVEVVLNVPVIDYALGCAGPIRAESGVTVGRIGAADGLDLEDLGPADVVSNAAIYLGRNTLVTGDVEAAGEVEVQPDETTVIRGAVKSHQAPARLPEIVPTDYDPQALGKPFEELTEGSYSGETVVEGIARRRGSLTLSGGLQLGEGLLFVDGDLIVEGKLEGHGIVVATGRVEIRGGAELTSSHMALLSGGDVRLQGRGKHSSFFRGLVYSGGNVRAEEICVVGALLAQGAEPNVLSNATVIASPRDSVISLGSGGGAGEDFFTEGAVGYHLASDGRIIPPEEWPVNLGDYLIAIQIKGGQVHIAARVGGANHSAKNPANPKVRLEELVWGSKGAAMKVPLDDWWDPSHASKSDPTVWQSFNESSDSGGFVVDPSRFLNLEDRLRVVLWNES